MGQRLLMLTALASLWAFFEAGLETNILTSAIQVASLLSIVLCVVGPRRRFQRTILIGSLIALVCFLLARFWLVSNLNLLWDRTDLPQALRMGGGLAVTLTLTWPLAVFAVAIYNLMRLGRKGSIQA